jgi:type IV secretion system protein VirB10
MTLIDRTGADPRLRLSESDLLEASSLRALPQVARPRRAGDGIGLAVGLLGALALGALTLVSLSERRVAPRPEAAPASPAERAQQLPDETTEALIPLPAFEPQMMVDEAAATPSQAMPMILDNTATPETPAATEAAAAANAGEGEEPFALRAGRQTGMARAQRPGNLSTTIVEGTLIPAVLETALNSNLPGNARAIVSRDVRSFDGSAVLVPRGSRLIGQYRTAASTGQDRVFIVWSRLVRPDGVSIELASPAADAAGAAGVAGEVDRRFFARFGSALLLSVVGALPALADGSSSTVVIGSNTQAQSAAGQALQSDARIAPTIRVPIGTPIQVFTTRDLSFD